ncbi:MAG: pantoate--beta-alanine ligase, partial [Gammaproteobacteria bacterium]|nr:pantoate--beta-alanine ligase [Gammaproteobacteria bacterium]NIR96344.1 pantoate--beta-alanine ligase [Gammaproteobacteria bacterium]NIW47976.1 pantoate--beta-alanine ligase [Gammaproteobacteria bacterium]NIX02531.1 pantoate--beta-alanine ligase [Phycisphaerae bacterium]
KNTTRDILINEGFELDYLDVVNQQDLSPWTPGQPGVILAAVLLDKIRLIDNIKI